MKRLFRFFPVFTVISMFVCPAFAEGVWTEIQDTPAIEENSHIAASGDGVLWMTTQRSGVFRYDGSTWTRFTDNDRLLSSSIYDIDVAPNGDVWIVSSTELSCFDGENWTSYVYPVIGDLFSKEFKVTGTPDGVVWCGVRGSLLRFQDGTWAKFGKKDGFPAESLYVNDISTASDQKVLVSFYYVDETKVSYNSDGNQCWEYSYGVYLFNGNTWISTRIKGYQGVSDITESFSSLAYSPDGKFRGSYDSIFYSLEESTWMPVYRGPTLGYRGMAVNSRGNIWGTSINGASVYNGEKMVEYHVFDSEYPLDLASGKNDEIWLLAEDCLYHYAPGDVAVEKVKPQPFVLHGNYPNPFNGSTTISYRITRDEMISLSVYNCMGQKIRSLYSGAQSPGNHTISWNGRNDHGETVSSGIYFSRLASDGEQLTRRMIYLK